MSHRPMLPFLCANDSPTLASGLLARRSDARERLEPVGDSPGDGDGLLAQQVRPCADTA